MKKDKKIKRYEIRLSEKEYNKLTNLRTNGVNVTQKVRMLIEKLYQKELND